LDIDDVMAFDVASRTWRTLLAPAHPDSTPLTPAAMYTCPPGTDPDQPGPADQVTPQSISTVAFDRGSGRIVGIGLGSSAGARLIPGDRIWTFDVCTNTWSATNASPYPPPQSAVYDPRSDLVIFFGQNSAFTYDSDSGALDQLSETTVPGGQAIYRSLTGQVVIRSALGLFEYDVPSRTLTELPQSGELPPPTAGLVAYDSSTDQLVLYTRDGLARRRRTRSRSEATCGQSCLIRRSSTSKGCGAT
jgi:hypothetical protein